MTIFKTLLLLTLCFATINCSKITFSAIDEDNITGSEPHQPADPSNPVSKKLDILIVIDNSSSMLQEHSVIHDKLLGFNRKLKSKGLDYRMAVTTTDAREVNSLTKLQTPRGFGGKVISFKGKNFVSSSTYNPEELVLASLDRSLEASCGTADLDDNDYWLEDESDPEICSTDYEEPVKVIKQFLKQKDTANSGFLRSGVPLVALIITDEDIESFDDKNMNMSQQLASIKILKSNFKAYGIIAQEGDIARCNANWSGNVSQKVEEFISLSGGKHNSICDANYVSIFEQIAKDY
ncbi:MAG: hypothetical protein HAW60_05045 [Bdellovibrionales bacterium]|nr:hypothetical protein [Bdellovibrionales bacterium]